MLPASLGEAVTEEPPVRLMDIKVGQRFIDGNCIIFERVSPDEVMVITGEQAGEFVLVEPFCVVKKVTFKKT